MAASFFSSAFVIAVEFLAASISTASPDMLSLLPLLQKFPPLLTEHYVQLSREQPSAIAALASFLSSLLSNDKAAPEVLSQTLSILLFLQCAQKSCEAMFSSVRLAAGACLHRYSPLVSLNRCSHCCKSPRSTPSCSPAPH